MFRYICDIYFYALYMLRWCSTCAPCPSTETPSAASHHVTPRHTAGSLKYWHILPLLAGGSWLVVQMEFIESAPSCSWLKGPAEGSEVLDSSRRLAASADGTIKRPDAEKRNDNKNNDGNNNPSFTYANASVVLCACVCACTSDRARAWMHRQPCIMHTRLIY